MTRDTPSPQSVVVPVEPTEAMLRAVSPISGHRVWSAMLAAAPAPSSLAALLAQDEVRKIGLMNMTDELIQRVDDLRAKAIAKATAGETRNAEPIHRRDGDEG